MRSSDIVSKEVMEQLSRVAECVPDSLVKRVAPMGDVDQIIDWLEERANVGAKHMVIAPTCGSPEDNLRALREEILPYFKSLDSS